VHFALDVLSMKPREFSRPTKSVVIIQGFKQEGNRMKVLAESGRYCVPIIAARECRDYLVNKFCGGRRNLRQRTRDSSQQKTLWKMPTPPVKLPRLSP
jgi:hypothetical protein